MNSRSTKRALFSSFWALLLCFAMLLGTTFAWFTDTASTSVNKIQAGTLDIELQMNDGSGWVNAEGKVLNFIKAAGHETEAVLWEPGATYKLPEIKIVNKGNLALKYEVYLSATGGDLELAKVLKISMNGDEKGTLEQVLAAAAVPTEGNNGYAKGNLAGNTESGAISISMTMDTTAGNEYQGKTISGIAVTVVATQDTVESDSNGTTYDAGATYPTVQFAASLEEVFASSNVNFSANNTATEPVVLDGQGAAFVTKWTDAWINSDTTIKGVTFENGAVFSLKNDNVTVTLENCTFYACDQSKLTYAGNNTLTNSGAGMCLNLEKSGHTGAKFIVKNCTFIGENDNTLPAGGNKYNADGTVADTNKKRGHAIALDAICGGGTGTLDSMLIEGCTIDGVRGNAIQLYGTTGDITIKDTKINSWAVNNTNVGFAVRGDFETGGNRTLTLTDVYFGLPQTSASTDFGHVYVGAFSGNTTGAAEAAGTYSK